MMTTRIHGVLEVYNEKRIAGWAALPREGVDAALTVSVDGIVLGQVTPSVVRTDPGCDGLGFDLPIPEGFRFPEQACWIRVCTADSGIDIANSPVRVVLPTEKVRSQVMTGQDGWLFLANDSNGAHDQMAGQVRLPAGFRSSWVDVGAEFNQIERRGIPVYFMTVPNKECVATRQLPNDFRIVPWRPLSVVCTALSTSWRGYFERFSYPLAELKSGMPRGSFPKGDTHWSMYGAWLAVQRTFAVDYPMQVRQVQTEIEQLGWAERLEHADLLSKLGGTCVEGKSFVAMRWPRQVRTNGRHNTGAHAMATSQGALSRKKVLFVRDSFGTAMLPFLGRLFSDIYMVWSSDISQRLIEYYKPDLILIERVERFLIRPTRFIDSDGLELV